ncbi:MAG: outer membrane beta-barrel protein [Steroidobacter sp.]
MSRLSLFVSSMLLLLSTAAHAFDKGLYLGGSVGQADVSITSSSNNIDFKDSDTAYKVFLGVRPLNWFAVEAGYADLGKPASAAYSATTNGISAFALGIWDRGPVDLFAKAGAINWNSKITSSGIKLSSRDSTDAAFGAGIQVSVLAIKIRGEYERFEVNRGTNMVSLGVVFTFL